MPLAKLLIALKGGNVNKVIGDNNITIQGVQGSTININSFPELEQKLTEFIERSKHLLYFIIFADDTEKPHEWKPFGQRSILESIQLCMSNVKDAKVVLWFIDPSKPIDKNIKKDLKKVKKDKSIILFNTNYTYCPLFEALFDHFEIGGCVAIPDRELTDINLEALADVRSNEVEMNYHKKTYNYALKNINSDFDIVEAINNIIAAYMKGYEFSQAAILPNVPNDEVKSPNQIMEL